MNRVVTAAGLVALVTLSSGCDQLSDVLDKVGVKLPTSDLARVDLVQNPSVSQVTTWSCHEWVGFGCSALGSKPTDKQMQFSFDLVFDLANPNDKIPIPLVELLLGMSVFKDKNLGAVCVSFCDPEEEDCVPTRDAEGSCEVNESDDAKGIDDIVPNVDELVDIGKNVQDGDFDNYDFRYIEPNGETEAHIQFDFGVSTTLELAEGVFTQAAEDALTGKKVVLNIPYTADGSVFFDVPEKGRKAVGFGPHSDTWVIE